ncbi:metallo-mystery pair system four-Cys motif protein [Stigmatella sp. ncwal1]|uniref:Metallo-mystery pair system four-Cys motif protein n=1 Tax=Stigmatella ashevillensis TaxID=2995309 RepID=A0ABT5DF13_9BACT|nr:MbnP family copper-binding protein [Stigmatella ashevillena]MDC0712241.1 metallo-mystery pair system four-Cys motif protein [Stigmatella ashevillena]
MALSSARWTALLPLLAASALGCGDDEPETPALTTLSIPFEARVGTQPFACGQRYLGLGTTKTAYDPQDFRMFVHDVRLVSDTGQEVPVSLTADGVWQAEGVALLDFANTAGLCSNGTSQINTQVVGTVPEGTYRGLRFRLGVPFALNHLDVSTRPPPFDDASSLYWGWKTGYLFLRIDGRTTGLPGGYFMHLGSADCAAPPAGQTSGTAGCEFPNRPEIALEGFEPGTGKVVVDLAALLADANLDVNADVPNTSLGCMSQKEDPDCTPIFHRMGISMDKQAPAPSAQSFIRVE